MFKANIFGFIVAVEPQSVEVRDQEDPYYGGSLQSLEEIDIFIDILKKARDVFIANTKK